MLRKYVNLHHLTIKPYFGTKNVLKNIQVEKSLPILKIMEQERNTPIYSNVLMYFFRRFDQLTTLKKLISR